MSKPYTIAAFEDVPPSDMAHDLAAMVDYLISAETDAARHYGLILFHKIIRDNLEWLAERVKSVPNSAAIPITEVQVEEKCECSY